ncbi:MAG: helix-turn-helix transcriptional regulator [Bacillales bacterium]|nr:helix-turn-helix transcriptional regulator [Bacillales bacterium]
MQNRDLSSTLVDLRKTRGITQVELGKHLGVTNKTISKWENGVFLPDILYLTAIADFYGITVDNLLRGNCFNNENRVIEKKEPKYLRVLDNVEFGYILIFDIVLTIFNIDFLVEHHYLCFLNGVFILLLLGFHIFKFVKKRKNKIKIYKKQRGK